MTMQPRDPNEGKIVEELTDTQREFARVLGRVLAQRWQEEQSVQMSNPKNGGDEEGASLS